MKPAVESVRSVDATGCSCGHADSGQERVTAQVQGRIADAEKAQDGDCPLCEFLTLKRSPTAPVTLDMCDETVACLAETQIVSRSLDVSHSWRERAPPVC
ncbi:MAG: hypothetical protein VB858_17695 [Planctomycetaceae bacterium]